MSAVSLLFCQLHDTIGEMACSGGEVAELRSAPNGHKPPIGAPEEFIKKYRGKFDDGYDKLRERILARQLELGIVPPGTRMAARPAGLPAWDTLSDLDKKVGARWMEVFTAAVEHTDYQIGRIVQAIEDSGEFDNTLIVYIAGDNGPTPEGGLHGINNKLTYANGIRESLEDVAKHIDDFGSTHSHGCNPAAWSYATSTPYTYGKLVTSGGGNSTAMAISWPARIKKPGIRRQFVHLIDVMPTILESAGLPEPKRVNGVEQKPLEGVSMVYAMPKACLPPWAVRPGDSRLSSRTASRLSFTAMSAWSTTRSPPPKRCRGGRARFALTSRTTAAARGKAAPARCRLTAKRWARAGSSRQFRSCSRRTTPLMWARTGGTPVSPDYELPAKFTGDLKKVTIEVREH